MMSGQGRTSAQESGAQEKSSLAAPSISLPKGGGAIKGIGEKFAANPVTGTGSMTVPIATSLSRAGFGPQLSLSYDSGAGNGPFGLGWNLSLPAITRKTDKGLPQYRDAEESDVFILSGAEDLVPELLPSGERFTDSTTFPGFVIHRYRPRIEGLFARIERWTDSVTGEVHWRSITKDNITTLYGKENDARIFDPADPDPLHPTRIFSWLICQSYDDKGNAIIYKYVAEDDRDVDHTKANERNRVRTANRYLKHILYGNRTPNRDLQWKAIDPTALPPSTWMFEVVFDYGEHNQTTPLPNDGGVWPRRNDPFSTYRASFEVRTYRLCQRVLMFHHFSDEPEVGVNCLVRSTDFTYGYEANQQATTNPIFSQLRSVTQNGYKRNAGGGYIAKSLPPLEFTYSEAVIQDDVHEVDPTSLENLPYGLDGSQYQWVDLDGEGLSGILTEQADGWFYKRNLSPINVVKTNGAEHIEASFAPVELVANKPVLSLDSGHGQFLDLAGDGQLDLVALSGPTPGFYERTLDEGWEPFTPFASLPVVDWGDPNLKFVDLTGDGHADVLISEDEVLCWHPSRAEDGFGTRETTHQSRDEEHGPKLVFADAAQSIYLADLSGDGLTDLVRIRNGDVCYWPNLGYGRFGAKVTMDNAPWFDRPDQFDQQRIRLADIDGSGVTDILYLSSHGIQVYFNQSGNSWSAPTFLTNVPATDNVKSITVVDLFGNGTACLVWSSPLPGDARRTMRYINLIGEQKPHLLVKTVNNLGAETVVHYAPSTKFYLEDKYAGKPWITRLPFPVHVVERVETFDLISRNRFVTRYSYHHGYFDGVEREFRGFGMVEQLDTEEFAALNQDQELSPATNIDISSHVPPVLTRSWFHTGIYVDRDHVSDFFESEYYREPGLSDQQAKQLLLQDTILPPRLTVAEEREACRALKGAMLRQEVYALDGTNKQPHPYAVTEQNFTIRLVQPQAGNRFAVFFTHAREALSYHYERNPNDPRLSHALTLEVDGFGNVLKSAAIGYGRRQPDVTLSPDDRTKQADIHITYSESRVTNAIETDGDHYRTPLACESRTYELTGLTPLAGQNRFTFDETLTAATNAAPLAYEQSSAGGTLLKRLIEHVRTLYRPNDLGATQNDALALLPLGMVESLALPGESYQLAFTPGLLDQIYVRNGQRLLPANPADVLAGGGEDRGGYVDLDGDGHWWIPSGRIFLSPSTTHGPVQELTEARQHFFLPRRYRDPFHTNTFSTESFVTYDPYDLLMVETRDALSNTVHALNNYRVLAPRLMTDPNGNRSEVAFDVLGMVVGTAVMGKANGPVEGDLLDASFQSDLTQVQLNAFFASPRQPSVSPTESEATPIVHELLGNATSRIVYDLDRFQRVGESPVAATVVRETHVRDLAPGLQSKLQVSFSYSDGFGREIQKKIQAEPGPVPRRNADGTIIVGADGQPEMTPNDVSPRWVGSGWTIFNNKGKPVRQFEPFFTDRHPFEFDVRIGVSPVLFYDPVERVVATLHPNHTWEKVVFDPWRQETWDVNDTTLLVDPKADRNVGQFFRRLTESEYLPTWQALRTDPIHLAEFTARYPDATVRTNETRAAEKTAVHAATPSIAHADSLGRTFLTIAHNKFKYSNTPPADPPIEEFYRTRIIIDIEGNQREVIDAKDRIVMRYDYDMLGNRIHQASMEAGDRWMLNDVSGQPLYAWDSRNQLFHSSYDQLRRPVASRLREGAGSELMVGRTVYGESQPNPEANNLRGKVVRIFDQAGIVTTDAYDFKGNLLRSQRQLAREYKTALNWGVSPELEQETFTGRTTYDALNRPLAATSPDGSVYRLTFNESNLLEKIDVNLRGATPTTPFVTDIDYDAKGQRTRIDYGNGVTTTYEYDRLTFRLTLLKTRRNAASFDATDRPGEVQNLRYTYDPTGNISHIEDDAQQTVYFRNKRVEPSADYTHDAVYRLIEATGREHLGQVGGVPIPHSYNDVPRIGIDWSANDGNAMGRYLEQYVYDAVGNFKEMGHVGSDPVDPGWTRSYAYNEPSLLESNKQSNRLTLTTIGATTETYSTNGDGYDTHGNMLRMPQLQIMLWDFNDHLHMTQRQAVNNNDDEGIQRQGERTYYVYDLNGLRARKVTERQNGSRKNERIYLSGFEIYREYDGGGTNVTLEHETLHVMDDKQRIALIETKTIDDQSPIPNPDPLIRYQFGNHLGSASLELDAVGQIISYEEYYPYGSTSYQAVRSQTDTPKRYQYTGMEREKETGFAYHGARYYVLWLGRWCSTDPISITDDINLYAYVHGAPEQYTDTSGRGTDIADAKKALRFESELKKALDDYGADSGLTLDDVLVIVMLESGGDPKLQKKGSSYKGLFQIKEAELKGIDLTQFNKNGDTESGVEKKLLESSVGVRLGVFVLNTRITQAKESFQRSKRFQQDVTQAKEKLEELEELDKSLRDKKPKTEEDRKKIGELVGEKIDAKKKLEYAEKLLKGQKANFTPVEEFIKSNPSLGGYLLHQMGLSGLTKILSNPNEKPKGELAKNMKANLDIPLTTNKAYIERWKEREQEARKNLAEARIQIGK